MTPSRPAPSRLAAASFVLASALSIGQPADAQTAASGSSGGGLTWQQLSPAEQAVLQPLRAQWNDIESTRRQKWRDIAALHPKLTPEQRERLRSRMTEWAAMTPGQRNAARLNFEEARQIPASERQARWQAWQQLPEAQRRALSEQAASRPAPAGPVPAAVRRTPATDSPQPKNNIVSGSPVRAQPQPVALGTVQTGPGASTRPIGRSAPMPPRHQPVGLPKIAATPGFVDSTTLLPSRGPQGTPMPAPALSPAAVAQDAPAAPVAAAAPQAAPASGSEP